MNNFSELLSYFKKSSTPEKVVALMGDHKLIKALLAWKSVIITANPDIEMCEIKDDNARWEWLWEQVKWDEDKYNSVTGLKIQEVNQHFKILKGLKLIYPDGTIDLFASQYLNSIIMSALKKK